MSARSRRRSAVRPKGSHGVPLKPLKWASNLKAWNTQGPKVRFLSLPVSGSRGAKSGGARWNESR